MPGGYEKSPDYGGRPPSWGEVLALLVVAGMVAGAFINQRRAQQPVCRVVRAADVPEKNGKAYLDLRTLKPDECIVFGPEGRAHDRLAQ